jgi:hypothetical protein
MRGIALLWLRIALAVLLARQALASWDGSLPAFLSLFFCLPALFLLAGLFTPAVSLLSAALEAYVPSSLDLASWPLPFLAISVFAAVSALGPGAYSLDALFYGRKKLTIGRSPS